MQETLDIFNTNSSPILGIILALLSGLPVLLLYTFLKPKNVKRDIKDKKMNLLSLFNFTLFIINLVLLIVYGKSFNIINANIWFGIMGFFYVIYYEIFIRYIIRDRESKWLYSRLLYIKVPFFISQTLSMLFAAIWAKCIPLIITTGIFSLTQIYNSYYKYIKFYTEYRDLYDEKRNKTGKKVLKDGFIRKGLYYVTVVVFIYNPKNKKWLMQKRTKDKGGKWATTSGHPVSGETSKEGMCTEIKEELGIDVREEELEFITTVKRKDKFADIYYLEKDIEIDDLSIQKEELTEVLYMTKKDIERFNLDKKFKKTHYMYFQELMDKMKSTEK